ncbi:MAG: hypothetical protein ACFB6R_13535 [Alphaproteobacteria bacterium]
MAAARKDRAQPGPIRLGEDVPLAGFSPSSADGLGSADGFGDPIKAVSDLIAVAISGCGADAYVLHAYFEEALASFDPVTVAQVHGAILDRPEPVIRHLAAYWCLDPRPAVRSRAIDALNAWSAAGMLTEDDGARLGLLRGWLPADDAARLPARKKYKAIRTRLFAIERVFASLPDGAGAQTIMIPGRRGRDPVLLCILIKEGPGVADAYEVAFETPAEQVEALRWTHDQLELYPVSLETVLDLMARALADGLENGQSPSHGLLDVLVALGLDAFAPQPATAADRLAHIDRENALEALSKQKIGRLINASALWPTLYVMVMSWAEDIREIPEAGRAGPGGPVPRSVVGRFVDGRRERWARLAAQSAAVLKDAAASEDFCGPWDWLEMAAVGRALLENRPLRKIPIMQKIIDETLGEGDEAPLADDLTALLETISARMG